MDPDVRHPGLRAIKDTLYSLLEMVPDHDDPKTPSPADLVRDCLDVITGWCRPGLKIVTAEEEREKVVSYLQKEGNERIANPYANLKSRHYGAAYLLAANDIKKGCHLEVDR